MIPVSSHVYQLLIRKRRVATFLAAALVLVLVAIVLKHRAVPDQAGNPQPNFDAYTFADFVSLPVTSVKVQGMSGTCWSFAGTSFLESELIRLTGKEFDLSEMYSVRHAYEEKARNYIYRQGTARFTEGGLIHDVLISAAKHGIATEDYYSGLLNGKTNHDHRELFPALQAVVTNHSDPSRHLETDWRTEVEDVLDEYLGKLPAVTAECESSGPQGFLEQSTLNMDDYISLTSFNHSPFHAPFVLEIPANFASERFYNLPIDELMENVDHALEQGFTLALDCDLTEPYVGNGVVVLPLDGTTVEQVSNGEFEEANPTQESRQSAFEDFRTTDDHLMHIVGKATDQFGRNYYKAKNCWGINWGREGFAYLSEAYLKMKVISVTLHKDGLIPSTRTALQLPASKVVSSVSGG